MSFEDEWEQLSVSFGALGGIIVKHLDELISWRGAAVCWVLCWGWRWWGGVATMWVTHGVSPGGVPSPVGGET